MQACPIVLSYFLQGDFMKKIAEFRVKNDAGKELLLEQDGEGRTYLDFGYTKLPRNFTGYRIKDSDCIVDDLGNGKFKLQDSNDTYNRI
jgi:hypothetical protein